MFLACRSRCGHCEVYPRSGLGRGLRCSFLPLRYCTRFLAKYKARRMPRHCGNRWEMPYLRKIHSSSHNNKKLRNSYNLRTHKPCCCDDWCESVDTQETPITHLIYGADLQVANCEYLGKRPACSSALHGIRELVHFLQHIFRAFFTPSQQGMNC